MTYPNEYKYVHEALVNSLSSETESYRHYRDYLVSGNKTEDDLSTDLLSQAFQYEQIYSKFLSMPLPNPLQNLTSVWTIIDECFTWASSNQFNRYLLSLVSRTAQGL